MNKIKFIEKNLKRNTSDSDLIKLFFGKDPNIEKIITPNIYCHLYFLDGYIIIDLFLKDNSEITFIRNTAISLENKEFVDKLYQILIYKYREKIISEL